MKSEIMLKSVLLLIGVAVILLGLNIGLGGIRTLGWQMSSAFFKITNEALFNAHDSHIRFIGGVWFSVGVVYLFGGFFLDALRPALVILCAVIAVAGLFRLSGLFLGAEFSPAIWTSFALEVIGFPCLGWWLGHPFMQRFRR